MLTSRPILEASRPTVVRVEKAAGGAAQRKHERTRPLRMRAYHCAVGCARLHRVGDPAGDEAPCRAREARERYCVEHCAHVGSLVLGRARH
eukprot:3122988-Pleurochrysis_carterae.AAC.4